MADLCLSQRPVARYRYGRVISYHISSREVYIHGTHAFGLTSRQLDGLMVLVDEADSWSPRHPDGGCRKHELT
jgi:hypothetical protein